MSELLHEEEQIQEAEGFTVKDDAAAEWCLKKIQEANDTKAFWKAHYDEQYRKICETADADISVMMHHLEQYFNTVPHKVTKTEENYRLPSGKLVLKKQSTDFEKDEKAVIAWLKANGGEKFIKTKESLDWDSLKNTLTVCGDSVADEDGQIIPCITAVDRPAVFKIGK